MVGGAKGVLRKHVFGGLVARTPVALLPLGDVGTGSGRAVEMQGRQLASRRQSPYVHTRCCPAWPQADNFTSWRIWRNTQPDVALTGRI